MRPEQEVKLTVNQKIASGAYENKKPYSSISKDRSVWEAYGDETARLNDMFHADCAEEFEVTGNKKETDLFRVAWSLGHSSGYSEVWNYYSELVCLIK